MMKRLRYKMMGATMMMAVLLSGGLTACYDDLQETVWISDPADPLLPAYSEWGYNTYGAYINGRQFASPRYYENSSKVWSADDSLHIEFGGAQFFEMGTSSVTRMEISLPRPTMSDYAELADLDGEIIDLAAEGVSVTLDVNSRKTETKNLTVSKGTLNFRRVQLLHVDMKLREAILSGTFEFEGTDADGKRYEVSDGRFDIGVNNMDEHWRHHDRDYDEEED